MRLNAMPGLFAAVFALGCATKNPAMTTAAPRDGIEADKRSIQSAFERWRQGTGGPFELLAPEATWTITGNSLAARTYSSRDDFMNTVISPFNARLKSPLVPTIRSLHGDGDTVIVLFDGVATGSDGGTYRNTYAWFMKMKAGRIVEVTAFFDAIEFDEFWKRVKLRSNQ